jgi:hypothetical protein
MISSNTFCGVVLPAKGYVKIQNIIYIFTTFFLTLGTWLKIVQGLDSIPA